MGSHQLPQRLVLLDFTQGIEVYQAWLAYFGARAIDLSREPVASRILGAAAMYYRSLTSYCKQAHRYVHWFLIGYIE